MTKTPMEINFELLRMARELVMNEYIDRKAKLHNRWLMESDVMWKNKRVRVAYPDMPNHPTEEDVVKRAKTLFKFLNPTEEVAEEQAPIVVSKEEPPEMKEKTTETSEPTELTETTEVKEEVNEPLKEQEPATTEPEKTNTSSPTQVSEAELADLRLFRTIDDETTTSTRLLPTLLERLELLKKSLKN